MQIVKGLVLFQGGGSMKMYGVRGIPNLITSMLFRGLGDYPMPKWMKIGHKACATGVMKSILLITNIIGGNSCSYYSWMKKKG